jgi:hypothetical protein
MKLHSLKILLLGMFLGSLGLWGCQKAVEVPKAEPAVVTPAPTQAVPDSAPKALVVAPAEESKVDKQVVKVEKKKVQKSDKGSAWKAEQAAYAKAKANVARADCLRGTVDYKLDGDVRRGEMRDFGNILESGMCEPDKVAAKAKVKYSQKAKVKSKAKKAKVAKKGT